jgi:glycyl-tRNA synthetase beta chain
MSGQLMVELVVEEIPASFVRPALASLANGVTGLLGGLAFGDVRTYATPRRLAVVVDDVQAARPLEKRVITGPPADRAFKDGEPTKAALGFARGKGVDPSALHIVEGPKGPVVAVEIEEGGETTLDLVGAGLPGVVTGIPFRKSMEWGAGGLKFARPLHRVNALYDGVVVPGSLAGIPFGDRTVGHRLTHSDIEFEGEADWLAKLRENAVEPDLDAREQAIRALLAEATAQLGCDPIEDDLLLEEVLHLVEAPTLVIGSFDQELLALPSRLLIKAMKAHQRYFPVFRGGALSHEFVVISNNPWGKADTIAEGNANVLRARFHDAKFFFAEDKKKRLEQHATQLEKMRWIRGLGTMADKQRRVAGLAATLADHFGANPDHAKRAGELCKADLPTQMVGEFPDLQGHMGRLYATSQGEPEAVALAIEEHYQPASADDSVAGSPEGAALAVADRLDTLVGCFGIGMKPKGSGDPQGLRRAMLGIQRTLLHWRVRFELHELFDIAARHFSRAARSATARLQLAHLLATRDRSRGLFHPGTPDNATLEKLVRDALADAGKPKALFIGVDPDAGVTGQARHGSIPRIERVARSIWDGPLEIVAFRYGGADFEHEVIAVLFGRLAAKGRSFDAWWAVRPQDANAETQRRAHHELCDELTKFATARFKADASGREGVSGDLVDAVLAVGSTDAIDRQARLDALLSVAGSDDFLPIMHTFKRVLNITGDHVFPAPLSDQLTEDAERTLFAAAEQVDAAVTEAVQALDYDRAFAQVLTLATPVADFFDAVLVDAPDPAVKAVRMGLLLRVAAIFRQLADFSRISTR